MSFTLLALSVGSQTVLEAGLVITTDAEASPLRDGDRVIEPDSSGQGS